MSNMAHLTGSAARTAAVLRRRILLCSSSLQLVMSVLRAFVTVAVLEISKTRLVIVPGYADSYSGKGDARDEGIHFLSNSSRGGAVYLYDAGNASLLS